jgi:tetratricopeptide (TPR) repeat protein
LGRIEAGLCNYEAAIDYYREGVTELQKEKDPSLSDLTVANYMGLATSLLKQNTGHDAEAFAIFQEELDRCVEPSDDREQILFQMGIEYRNLNKWDQSIDNLQQLCLSASRPESTMAHQANEERAKAYLERYCTDTTLDIYRRTEILCHAAKHSVLVLRHVAEGKVSTEIHILDAQLFYFNGEKHEAYRRLELYLDARVA